MALVLVATAGASNANSYATAAEGDTYFETKLYATDWTDATTGTKEAALVWATRILDEGVDWAGSIMDKDQGVRWPRWGAYDRDGWVINQTTVPQFIKNAAAETALHLIKQEHDFAGADFETSWIKRLKVDVIELDMEVDKKFKVIPDSVWPMISHVATKASHQTRRLTRI